MTKTFVLEGLSLFVVVEATAWEPRSFLLGFPKPVVVISVQVALLSILVVFGLQGIEHWWVVWGCTRGVSIGLGGVKTGWLFDVDCSKVDG